MFTTDDTIVAIATAKGRAGIGVVRVSGAKVQAIIKQALTTGHLAVGKACYTSFLGEGGEVVDKGVALFFKAPNSFTGEDVLELQGHGAPVVQNALVNHIVNLGARVAEPGEFSKRAFLSGKIDLAQAEAIADLIHADSLAASRCALRSMEGVFSSAVEKAMSETTQTRAHVEAILDFPEEEIEEASVESLTKKTKALQTMVGELLKKTRVAALLNEGNTAVIAGPANTGKSSLINKLAQQEVAIVTQTPGTTRDLLSVKIDLFGDVVTFVDTAGIRETKDHIEKQGIVRAKTKIKNSEWFVLVFDVFVHKFTDIENFINKNIPKGNSEPIVLLNKIDIEGSQRLVDDVLKKNKKTYRMIPVSVKQGINIDNLVQTLKSQAEQSCVETDFIARQRHVAALEQALSFFSLSEKNLLHKQWELLAENLRLAHNQMGSIVGKVGVEDLLSVIFSKFCIGK
jgi:tRNA modification GTPase